MYSAHLFSLNRALEEPLESCEINTRALISPLNCGLRQQSWDLRYSALFPPPDSNQSGDIYNLILFMVLPNLR